MVISPDPENPRNFEDSLFLFAEDRGSIEIPRRKFKESKDYDKDGNLCFARHGFRELEEETGYQLSAERFDYHNNPKLRSKHF